jgi:hypothetical protein
MANPAMSAISERTLLSKWFCFSMQKVRWRKVVREVPGHLQTSLSNSKSHRF